MLNVHTAHSLYVMNNRPQKRLAHTTHHRTSTDRVETTTGKIHLILLETQLLQEY